MSDIAVAADVSRRTVYMYFPTLERLMIDATLGVVSRTTVDAALDEAVDDVSVEHRVEQMARAVQRTSAATEHQGRLLMRLSADALAAGETRALPTRGFRRVEWIERAVAPLRTVLDAARFERLVSALAMVVGWEALMVQRDVRGLNVADAEELSAWAARALLKATLDETPTKAPKRPTKATATTAKAAKKR